MSAFPLRSLRALAVTLSLAAVAPAADAQPLRFDVNHLGTAGYTPTQSGWTGVGLGLAGDVSFLAVGGVLLETRDRGAANSAAGSTFADMWRDFLFADERNRQVGSPAGVDIAVANLKSNTWYAVSLWAFDDVSTPSREMTWNGNPYAFSGTDPLPFDLSEKRVTFNLMTNASGIALLQGRTVTPLDGGCCSVFVNGFELVEVPEPGTSLLAATGLALLVGVARRRREG